MSIRLKIEIKDVEDVKKLKGMLIDLIKSNPLWIKSTFEDDDFQLWKDDSGNEIIVIVPKKLNDDKDFEAIEKLDFEGAFKGYLAYENREIEGNTIFFKISESEENKLELIRKEEAEREAEDNSDRDDEDFEDDDE